MEIVDQNSKTYELRSLSSTDISSLLEIEASVYSEPWSRKLFEESLVAPMTHSLGVFESQECVGYAIFQVVFSEGHLLNLAIRGSRQGQGLGGRLLDRVLEESQRKGARSFFLEVRPTNEPAKKLYENRGFRPLMMREKYYHDGEAALIMIKEFRS